MSRAYYHIQRARRRLDASALSGRLEKRAIHDPIVRELKTELRTVSTDWTRSDTQLEPWLRAWPSLLAFVVDELVRMRTARTSSFIRNVRKNDNSIAGGASIVTEMPRMM